MKTYKVTFNKYGQRVNPNHKDIKMIINATSSTQARREADRCGMDIKLTTASQVK